MPVDAKNLLSGKKLYLFDMDGTIYCGGRLYPFTKELLETLRNTGRKYMYMTNNSATSVEDYIRKLAGMGIPAVKEEFITSAQATIQYLLKHHREKPLYLCGTRSICREFQAAGLKITRVPEQARAVVV